MAKSKATPPGTLHELKITLLDLKPPVWRLVRVRSDATLGQLHGVIQAAMGWMNCHLHAFRVKGASFSDPEFELEGDEGDEFQVPLAKFLARPGDMITYEYDFGDGWEHEVRLMAVVPALPSARRAECIGGARACPIDDVGGTGGYEHLLEVLADPHNEEHAELQQWFLSTRKEYAEYDRRFEGPFDSEAFDPRMANAAIDELSLGRRWDPPA